MRELVEALIRAWGGGTWADRSDPGAPHEAASLRLRIEKARSRLGWAPRWDIAKAVRATVEWYQAFHTGTGPAAMQALTLAQIHGYEGAPA